MRELFGCDSLNILCHVRPDGEGPLHHWEVLDPVVPTKRQNKDFGFSEITEILSSCRDIVENCVQSLEKLLHLLISESTLESIVESMEAATPHHCQLSSPKLLCMLLLRHLKKTPIDIGPVHEHRDPLPQIKVA